MTTAVVHSTRPAADPFTHPKLVAAPAVVDVKAEFVVITPDVARDMLRRNTHNRPIRQNRVNANVRMMLAGQWDVNGEAVKIAHDGTILDGQHRLLAVVKSGVTITTLVVTGLPLKAQDTMDGGAKRTAGDVFALRGEHNSAILASVARKVWLWDNGDKRFSAGESATTPNSTPSSTRTPACAAPPR
ncbi:hypothetical protein ACFQ3Z_16450 [Streptomyces nogalater]